jgi:hypothetical protein
LSARATALGDLQLLWSSETEESVRLAALDRTVERIAWQPRSPRIRRALAIRAAVDGKDAATVKRQELRAAVYLVLGERGRPQVHRFGSRWLTGANGRQRPFIPERLPIQLFWCWFQDEVRKTAEASLAEGDETARQAISRRTPATWNLDSPRHTSPVDDPLLALPAESSDPLEAVLADEHRREVDDRWRAVLLQATSSQHRLLQTFLALESEGFTPSLAEVAHRLNRAPSTIRVQWKRLVDRMRARVNDPNP